MSKKLYVALVHSVESDLVEECIGVVKIGTWKECVKAIRIDYKRVKKATYPYVRGLEHAYGDYTLDLREPKLEECLAEAPDVRWFVAQEI